MIGLWWRNGERQVPYPSTISAANASDSVTASLTHVFDPTLTNETIFGDDLHRLPERDRRPGARSRARRSAIPTRASSARATTRSRRSTPAAGATTARCSTTPAGSTRPVRHQVAVHRRAEPDQGVGHAHRQGRRLLRAHHQQPARQRRQQRPHRASATWDGSTHRQHLRRPPDRPGQRTTTGDRRRTRSTTSPGTAWRCSSRTPGRSSPGLTLNFGARFSVFEPWSDREGNGIAVWDQSQLRREAAAGTPFPGRALERAATRTSRSTGVGTPFVFQPRIGFAWDVQGQRRDRAARRRRHVPVARRRSSPTTR